MAARKLRLPLLHGALAVALVLSGCGETDAAGKGPAESSAGSWKTWVLGSADEIAVPPPPVEADAELAQLRRVAATRTPAMAREVERWMEVNFDYVAERAKDPPAASRAYGLLSVAMYDATVAAWKAKYRYRRDPPRDVDALFEPSAAPSYPSEHAAIAGAASRVLAYLYPERPAARLDAMAERAARLRVLAGVSRPSDVRAGLALGRGVAAAVIARARRDGYRRRWDGERPHERGSWQPPPGSLARPVSPLAGTWRTWVMQSGDQFRAPPFPPYGSPAYRAQAKAVMDAKTNLTAEQKRIAKFWAGGQGTALPPGIWNQVLLASLRRSPLSLPRTARALAL